MAMAIRLAVNLAGGMLKYDYKECFSNLRLIRSLQKQLINKLLKLKGSDKLIVHALAP